MSREDLRALVSREYHPDYWSDDVVVRASDAAAKLTDADWSWLEAAWPIWPPLAQSQLADAIGGLPAARPVLVRMLASDDRKVATAAAWSLRDDPEWRPDQRTTSDLRRLQSIVTGPEGAIFGELLARHG